MRILITGGFGFIGSRLALSLNRAGHEIVLGTRKFCKNPDWLPQSEVVKMDWENSSTLEQSCKNVDVLVHAAGMNAQNCQTDPLAAMSFNGKGTENLVLAARKANIKRIIYLSTAHVYANPLVGVITEKSVCNNPHPYSISNLAGENAVLNKEHRNQTDGVVVRISNAFGVPAHKDVDCWKLLVNDLCRQAVINRSIVLHSNGMIQRDFISLTKVCAALECLLKAKMDNDLFNIFNLGGKSLRLFEMAHLVQGRCESLMGYLPKLSYQNSTLDQAHLKLEYKHDRFSRYGVPVGDSLTDEIDDLLIYSSQIS